MLFLILHCFLFNVDALDAEVAARVRFETDKNKHIELLLGGVSSTEFENLQSDRGSLDVCQVIYWFLCLYISWALSIRAWGYRVADLELALS